MCVCLWMQVYIHLHQLWINLFKWLIYNFFVEKIMVLAQKILQSSRLLIKSILMQNELLGRPYPKVKF
jgi:hypothetical protein